MVGIFIVISDQATKFLATRRFKIGDEKPLFGGKVVLTNERNFGAAMGFLSKHPVILSVFTALSLLSMLKSIVTYSEDKEAAPFLGFGFLLMFSGGLSNFIDRIRQGFVTDIIFFNKKKPTPIFNVADFFVIAGLIISLASKMILTLKKLRKTT